MFTFLSGVLGSFIPKTKKLTTATIRRKKFINIFSNHDLQNTKTTFRSHTDLYIHIYGGEGDHMLKVLILLS